MTKYSGKILLFGEYAIIKGAHGLAIPFNKFNGELKTANSSSEIDEELRLDKLVDYLSRSSILGNELDIERLSADLNSGLYFDSNIPYGHGIGSSGALCAAIFAKYSKNFTRENIHDSANLKYLQDLMALMEAFYHGTSSGLDCLISLVNRPILIEARNQLKVIPMPELDSFGDFYLLESGINRKTSPLVHEFLKNYEVNLSFKESFTNFMDLNNQIINSFLTNDKDKFKEQFYQVSKYQYLSMASMIPDHIKSIWLDGLESKKYFVKLCGAGGGGFFLIYSTENNLFNNSDYIKIN